MIVYASERDGNGLDNQNLPFSYHQHRDLILQDMYRYHSGHLPIVMLTHRCNRPLVQDVAVLVMKTCLECER